jgi:hypothetical protein
MAEKRSTPVSDKADAKVGRIATIAAGAAIGSAAIAAAILFTTRRRDAAERTAATSPADRPQSESD